MAYPVYNNQSVSDWEFPNIWKQVTIHRAAGLGRVALDGEKWSRSTNLMSETIP